MARGGGGVGENQKRGPTSQEEDTQAHRDGVPTNRNASGTSKLNVHRQFEKHDYNSETYVEKSHCMPGHKVPSIDQTPSGQTGTLSAELADHHSGPMTLQSAEYRGLVINTRKHETH